MTTRNYDGRIFREVLFSLSKKEIEAKKKEYQEKGYYVRVEKESMKSWTLWVAKKNLSESKIYNENRKHKLDKLVEKNLSRGQVYHRERKR